MSLGYHFDSYLFDSSLFWASSGVHMRWVVWLALWLPAAAILSVLALSGYQSKLVTNPCPPKHPSCPPSRIRINNLCVWAVTGHRRRRAVRRRARVDGRAEGLRAGGHATGLRLTGRRKKGGGRKGTERKEFSPPAERH